MGLEVVDEGSGFKAWGLGFRVWASGFRVQGTGFEVKVGSGCRVRV